MECANCCEAFVGTYEGYYFTKGADEIRLCRCCKDEYLALGGLGWKLVENTELIAKQIADDDDDCICESDKNPNPLCPDHQCCWACSTQSVPITLNEKRCLWLCGGCNDKGDSCPRIQAERIRRYDEKMRKMDEEFDKKFPNTDLGFLLKGLKLPSVKGKKK